MLYSTKIKSFFLACRNGMDLLRSAISLRRLHYLVAVAHPHRHGTLTFANANSGTLAYQVADDANVTNQTKAIAGPVFRAPGTVCQ